MSNTDSTRTNERVIAVAGVKAAPAAGSDGVPLSGRRNAHVSIIGAGVTITSLVAWVYVTGRGWAELVEGGTSTIITTKLLGVGVTLSFDELAYERIDFSYGADGATTIYVEDVV